MSEIPSGIPVPPPPGGGFVALAPRPRWSVAAIAGFILSFLLLLAPVGVVLGIVGVFRTRGGRRRGMGLAIASIPIGLVMSAFAAVVVLMLVMVGAVMNLAPKATEFMSASRVSVPQVARELYADCSDRFRVALSNEAFAAWAMGVVEAHGTMQRFERAKRWLLPADGGYYVDLKGEFINGPAHIRLKIGMNGMTPEIDDIEVDGVSALKSGRG